MGVKQSPKKPEWRREDVYSKVARILLKSEVLNNIESCIDFLEFLGEKGLRNSFLWNVADKAYHLYVYENAKRKIDVDAITNRYYKMFRMFNCSACGKGEDFPGEYRFNHHIGNPTEYSQHEGD